MHTRNALSPMSVLVAHGERRMSRHAHSGCTAGTSGAAPKRVASRFLVKSHVPRLGTVY